MKKSIIAIILTAFIIISAFYFIQSASAAAQVDVIDSIVITKETDTGIVLAEWSAHEPGITVYHPFQSAQAVKLFINWSDNGGAIDLHAGDYFTFVFPGMFDHSLIYDAANVEIKNGSGEVVATYSIYENSSGLKEVKMTFTDYVENHSKISGDLWFLLFVGNVSATENENLEFEFNGELAAQGGVTVNPGGGSGNLTHPRESAKYGYSSPENVIDGYYIFDWIVYLNMDEGTDNSGFHVLENFHFEDMIPQDSPHVFISNAVAQEFNIPDSYRRISIGEYTGSDTVSPEKRYQTFLEHYYSVNNDSWYDHIKWNTLASGLTSIGIDGQTGLNVSGLQVTGKVLSADLGTLTRPTAIQFYTISTIRISESALGDREVARLFENTFKGSAGQDLSASLTVYRFISGGSSEGIQGEYSFTFTKTNENDTAVEGAMFSLYTSEDFSSGADRGAFSDSNGKVTFGSLSAGVYYFQETIAPEDYVLDRTVYKVVIDDKGYEIYYGDDFENTLSDNQITNRSEAVPEPTPEESPEPTPEESPEPTPEESPEPTPGESPEPTPEEPPEPTPEESPETEEIPQIEVPGAEPEEPEPEPEEPEAEVPGAGQSETPIPQTGSENRVSEIMLLAFLGSVYLAVGLLIDVRSRKGKQ